MERGCVEDQPQRFPPAAADASRTAALRETANQDITRRSIESSNLFPTPDFTYGNYLLSFTRLKTYDSHEHANNT
jgi:hypothetical protein